MDQLLRTWLDENSNDRNRRSFTDTTANHHLEAVESAEKEAMGFAETRHRKRLSEADILLWKPLLLGSYKNVSQKGYFSTDSSEGRPYKLSRLL